MSSFKKALLLLTAAVYGLFGPVGAIGQVVCIENDGKIRLEISGLPGSCCESLFEEGAEAGVSGFLSNISLVTGECGKCLDILLLQESKCNKINTRNSQPKCNALAVSWGNALHAAGIKSEDGTNFHKKNVDFAPRRLSIIRNTRLLI